ncbi:MAG: CoA pyrophosphatase [Thermoanaerobaculia bacterium]|nr:CoA pyrophosphatase [Thermoanaerobaculia bacterium]
MSWIAEIRDRLTQPPPRRDPPDPAESAAVLVPLYVDAGSLWVLLTRRADDLEELGSQVSFPVAVRDTGEEFWEAAIRECEPTLGLDHRTLLQLGELDQVRLPGGPEVVPCVAAVPWPFEASPRKDEITEVVNLPLTAVTNPRLVETRAVEIDGTAREITVYHVGRHRIWGVTATILENLLRRLGMTEEAVR